MDDVINRLTSKWSGEFKANAEIVVKRIIDLIGQGYTAQAAINQAFIESDFAAKNKAALSNTLVEAAAVGYGIMPGIIVGNGIAEKLNTLPWAPDKMPLSTRLHGLDTVMRAKINDTIKAHMTNGTNMVKMARDLYDGYNDGKVIRTAELPAYLRRLEYYARKSLSMGLQPDIDTMRAYKKALKRAEKLVDEMNGDDVPTKALKTAYKQLLEAAQGFNQEALKKAVYTATQERSRYFAERIARTEIARAWADGFYAETLDDPDVVGYRWKLSARHPKFDVCDLHANADLYGLGPGVYPKDKMPVYPAHPHCTCHIVEVFKGESDKRQTNNVERAGRRYLKGLNESQQSDLLGQNGATAFHNGEDWRLYLKNWQGHENPSTRLSKKDFE